MEKMSDEVFMSLPGKHIRIFLSSVFDGMEGEREYIRTKVLPKAQMLCKKYSVTLTIIDLRWGITNEEVRDEMVLHRCLEEIDKSAQGPMFFIGLVGNRYGTVFDKSRIASYLKSPHAKYGDWLEGSLSKNQFGVTDLEFLYAEDLAKGNPNLKPLYYVRSDAYDDNNNSLLIDQLNRISKNREYLAIDGYQSLDEIGDHLLSELKSTLEINFSSLETLNSIDRNILAICSEVAVEGVQTDIYDEVLSSVLDNIVRESHPISLQGEAGSGKTYLLTQIKLELEARNSERVFLCFGNLEDPIDRALRYTVKLEKNSIENMALREKVKLLKETLENCTDESFILLIDAIDSENTNFDSTVPNHDILLRHLADIRLPKGVVLFLTYQSKCTFRPDLCVPWLSDDDLQRMLIAFNKRYGKNLPSTVFQLFSKVPLLKMPISVALIFNQLIHARDSAEVDNILDFINNKFGESDKGQSNSLREAFRWDDLVPFFIGSIIKDYPGVSKDVLSERLPAILNDYIGTGGISIYELSEGCNVPEVVLLEILERLRPALYIVDDHFRSRKNFFTGLNETKTKQRLDLLRGHFSTGDDKFTSLLNRNIETYFYWVMGGRTQVEQFFNEYESLILSPDYLLKVYRSQYTVFHNLVFHIRYLNPEYYLSLAGNFEYYTNPSLIDLSKIVRDPLFVIEYPLLALIIMSNSEIDRSKDISDLYEYSLSYQAYLVSCRGDLSSRSQGNARNGSSIANFMNFNDFGEIVYGTALYKTLIANGFSRFLDFDENVASKLESNQYAKYEYSKMLFIADKDSEEKILKLQKELFTQVFDRSPTVIRSDQYTRKYLKEYLFVL